MAKAEHPEKYNWWLNELDSLEISTLQKNGLNNQRGASDLAEAVKQTLYEEYTSPIVKVTDNKLVLILKIGGSFKSKMEKCCSMPNHYWKIRIIL